MDFLFLVETWLMDEKVSVELPFCLLFVADRQQVYGTLDFGCRLYFSMIRLP